MLELSGYLLGLAPCELELLGSVLGQGKVSTLYAGEEVMGQDKVITLHAGTERGESWVMIRLAPRMGLRGGVLN